MFHFTEPPAFTSYFQEFWFWISQWELWFLLLNVQTRCRQLQRYLRELAVLKNVNRDSVEILCVGQK